VLWLDFLEPSGSVAYDKSGYGNHGTIYGAQRVRALGRYGLEFDGVDDYVLAGHSGADNMTAFTFLAVLKHPVDGYHDRIIDKGSKILRLYSTTRKLRGDVIASTTNAYSQSALPLDKEHFHVVAMTYDDNTDRLVHLYVDGREVEYDVQVAAEGELNDDAAYGFHIGQNPALTRPFTGIISCAMVFSRALGEREIKAIADYFLRHRGDEV